MAISVDGSIIVASAYRGYLFVSSTSGASWTAYFTDQTRDWISVAASGDGSRLVAAVQGGAIYTSADSGQTWT